MKYAVLSIGIAALASATASAQIIYNNFGPGDTFSFTQGHMATSGTTSQPATMIAVPFTVNAPNLALDEIVFTASWSGAPLGYMGIHADSGSGAPGAALETLPIILFMTNPNSPVTVYMQSQSNPALTQGATYWAVMSVPANTSFKWYDNITGATGFSSGTTSGWTADNTAGRQPVLRIVGQPVPAPGACVLALAGGACVARRRQRRGASQAA